MPAGAPRRDQLPTDRVNYAIRQGIEALRVGLGVGRPLITVSSGDDGDAGESDDDDNDGDGDDDDGNDDGNDDDGDDDHGDDDHDDDDADSNGDDGDDEDDDGGDDDGDDDIEEEHSLREFPPAQGREGQGWSQGDPWTLMSLEESRGSLECLARGQGHGVKESHRNRDEWEKPAKA